MSEILIGRNTGVSAIQETGHRTIADANADRRIPRVMPRSGFAGES